MLVSRHIRRYSGDWGIEGAEDGAQQLTTSAHGSENKVLELGRTRHQLTTNSMAIYVAPHLFGGVELWGIGRQVEQPELAVGVFDELLDRHGQCTCLLLAEPNANAGTSGCTSEAMRLSEPAIPSAGTDTGPTFKSLLTKSTASGTHLVRVATVSPQTLTELNGNGES